MATWPMRRAMPHWRHGIMVWHGPHGRSWHDIMAQPYGPYSHTAPTDGRTDGGRTDTHRHAHSRTLPPHSRTDIQKDRQTDRQPARQARRQASIHAGIQPHSGRQTDGQQADSQGPLWDACMQSICLHPPPSVCFAASMAPLPARGCECEINVR